MDEYAARDAFGEPDGKKHHLGLLPQPFHGNLANGSVVVLMLNPGFTPADYVAEHNTSGFRQAMVRAIRQNNAHDEYPFIFLNPSFSWHTGFLYWEKRYGSYARLAAEANHTSYQQGLAFVSKKVACLQLVPYHSRAGITHSLVKKLSSSQEAINFVHQELLLKAEAGDLTLIVARGSRKWKVTKSSRNVVVFDTAQARGGYLPPDSPVGEEIVKRLGLA